MKQAIEERFPGRWIGKVVAQALPRADVQRYKDYGITIYHPNYEVWDKRLFSLISPGKERYVGREEWHRRIFDAVREGRLNNQPVDLLKEGVARVLRQYMAACMAGAATKELEAC